VFATLTPGSWSTSPSADPRICGAWLRRRPPPGSATRPRVDEDADRRRTTRSKKQRDVSRRTGCRARLRQRPEVDSLGCAPACGARAKTPGAAPSMPANNAKADRRAPGVPPPPVPPGSRSVPRSPRRRPARRRRCQRGRRVLLRPVLDAPRHRRFLYDSAVPGPRSRPDLRRVGRRHQGRAVAPRPPRCQGDPSPGCSPTSRQLGTESGPPGVGRITRRSSSRPPVAC